MKTILAYVVLLVIAVILLFVFGEVVKGFMYVFNLLPEWVLGILFIGTVIYYIKGEEAQDKEAKKAFEERMKQEKED